MAIKPKDIYEGTKKTHRAAKIIAVSLTLLLILAVALFFWLRQFAVYDEEGNATLILPFSQKAQESLPAGPEPSPLPSGRPDTGESPEEDAAFSPEQSPRQGREEGDPEETDSPEPDQGSRP